MDRKKIESVIESILFVWGELISCKMIADTLGLEAKTVYDILIDMQKKYEIEQRGISIKRVDKSFQFVTREANYIFIEEMVRPVKNKRLSQSALEVLALVAYKQPITRGDIEAVRGVKSDKVIEGLLEKEFIKEAGRGEGLGRPILYATTEKFLQYMGFESLKELPQIESFEDDLAELTQWEKKQISIDDLEKEKNSERVSD